MQFMNTAQLKTARDFYPLRSEADLMQASKQLRRKLNMFGKQHRFSGFLAGTRKTAIEGKLR